MKRDIGEEVKSSAVKLDRKTLILGRGLKQIKKHEVLFSLDTRPEPLNPRKGIETG